MKPEVAIVIPVHNRREKTLACLERLRASGDLARARVVVVDDGSTDGTGETIREGFPEVDLVRGDGTLWWTGGIALGMRRACEEGARFLVWLNDDALPEAGAIERLVELARKTPGTIFGGQAVEPETGAPSYGGIAVRGGRIEHIHARPGELLPADGLNGNLVCIPREVPDRIGFPDARRFPQYHGDATYTHAAKAAGFPLFICGDARSVCKNDHEPEWLTTRRSARKLVGDRFSVRSGRYWPAELGYYREVLGPVRGALVYLRERVVKSIALVVLVALLPHAMRVRLRRLLRGDESRAP